MNRHAIGLHAPHDPNARGPSREPRPRLRGLICFSFSLLGCSATATPAQQPVDVGPSQSPSKPVDAQPPAKVPKPVIAQAETVAPAIISPPTVRQPLEMTFVGDVIFGRYRPDGYDPIPDPGYNPFADIAELLKADLLIGNLETPLVRELPVKSPIGAKFAFGASKTMAQSLADAGFTAVSLANNHAFDQREKGMTQSPAILKELGVIPLGASRTEDPVFRLETIERNGWKLGFLAVTTRRNAPHREGSPVLPYLSTRELGETLVPLIAAGKQTHHAVIVVIHWGAEYADTPNYVQVREAHALIDAGAKLVIGHHAHVLQGLERYGDGLIAYNLGNFLFENTTSIPRLTGVLRVRLAPALEASCVEKVVFHPAYIKRTPTKHPVPATGGMGTRVRRRMLDVSTNFAVELREEGEDLVLGGLSCGSEVEPPAAAATSTTPG